MLLPRDLAILVISFIALFLSNYQSEYPEISLAWQLPLEASSYSNGRYPQVGEQLPQPIVTDLNGDGKNEVVLATREPSIQVYEISPLNIADMRGNRTHYASLLGSTRVATGQRPIGLATGYLTPFANGLSRSQVVIVLTENWTVKCFDSVLNLLWERTLHYRDNVIASHEDVAILASSIQLRKGDEGFVIIGGTRRSAKSSSSHFSYYALDGRTGELRWKHESGDFQREVHIEEVAEFQHQYKIHPVHETSHNTESSWRDFRTSILASLPHSWNSPQDTRIELHHYERFNQKRNKKSSTSITSGIVGIPFPVILPHSESEHINHPNVLVAHTSRGIEALHLYTGRTLCQLELNPGSLVDDFNGDNIIDTAISVSGKLHLHSDLASEHITGHQTPPCSLQVLSGIPPVEKLFNGSICLSKYGSNRFYMSSGQDNKELQAFVLPPIALRHPSSTSNDIMRKDIAAFSSFGAVSLYSYTGKLMWKVATGVVWGSTEDGTSKGQSPGEGLNTHSISSLTVMQSTSNGFDQRNDGQLLVIGDNKMAILSQENGDELGSYWLREPQKYPFGKPVLGDFDNDGRTDIILVCAAAIYGYSIRLAAPTKVLTIFISFIIASMLITSVATGRDDPDGHRNFKLSRKKRSTD